jgi:hypothetical protein
VGVELAKTITKVTLWNKSLFPDQNLNIRWRLAQFWHGFRLAFADEANTELTVWLAAS